MELKKIRQILALLITSTIGFTGMAQLPQPEAAHVNYDGKKRSSIEVIVTPEPKELKKAWHDYMENDHDINMKGIGWFSNKDVLTAEEVNITKLSSNTIDFHTKIIDVEDGTQMSVFAAKGYDIYINLEDHPKEFGRMELMLRDFLGSYIPEYYSNQIDNQADEVEDLVEKRASQEEDVEDKKEEIVLLKDEISSLEESIKQTESDIQETENSLNVERERLEELRMKLASLEK